MAYTPDIFSTQGGLTITAIRDWIKKNDADTLERWLTSGNEHPRLAAEAIGAAVEFNRPLLAERIWKAGWHKPGAGFKEAWQGWRSALSDHPHTRLPDAGKHHETWTWLLNKHTGATDKRTAKLHNEHLLEGMLLALHFDAPARWNDVIKTGLDCNSEPAHRVFFYALTYTSWVSLNYKNKPLPWVENEAIPQMLEAGFQPGGSLWIKALTDPRAQPFFNLVLDRADALTTSRMRAAILVSADPSTVVPKRWTALTAAFFELGVPKDILLTPKEAANNATPDSRMRLALQDIGWDRNEADLPKALEKGFTGPTLNVLDVLQPAIRDQFRLLFRSQDLAQDLPAPAPRRPKPRF